MRRHYPPRATGDQPRGTTESDLMRPALPALAVTVLLAASAGGCIYRVNIPQGNYLEAKTLDQVQVGMTRSQVRYLLGTPMIADPFHPDRWDYLYYFKDGRSGKVEKRIVVVFFGDEKVARLERPSGEFKDPSVHNGPVL